MFSILSGASCLTFWLATFLCTAGYDIMHTFTLGDFIGMSYNYPDKKGPLISLFRQYFQRLATWWKECEHKTRAFAAPSALQLHILLPPSLTMYPTLERCSTLRWRLLTSTPRQTQSMRHFLPPGCTVAVKSWHCACRWNHYLGYTMINKYWI